MPSDIVHHFSPSHSIASDIDGPIACVLNIGAKCGSALHDSKAGDNEQ